MLDNGWLYLWHCLSPFTRFLTENNVGNVSLISSATSGSTSGIAGVGSSTLILGGHQHPYFFGAVVPRPKGGNAVDLL